MISIEELRALLPKDENFTEEQIEKIRRTLYGLADALFERWLEERNRSAVGKLRDTG